MNKNQFDVLFQKCVQEFNVRNPDVMKEKIEKFRDSEGNLSAYQISLFVLQESLEYTNKMIYTLFSAIFEDNAHS